MCNKVGMDWWVNRRTLTGETRDQNNFNAKDDFFLFSAIPKHLAAVRGNGNTNQTYMEPITLRSFATY